MGMRERVLSLCVATVLLMGLTGNLSAESPTNPPAIGLYDGAVAVGLGQDTDSRLLLTNPQTMTNVPFKDVVTRVEELSQLQVVVDWQSLSDAGLDIDLNTKIPEWPAGESILQLRKRIPGHEKYELTWVVGDNLISLMTAEQAKEKYTTQRYYIGDLLSEDFSAEQISNFIQEHASGPWEADEPGTGAVTPFGNHLFIRQTFRVQQEVKCILAALRSQAPIVLIYRSEEDLRLRRMWDEKVVNFDWPQLPLSEFFKRIGEMTGVRFKLEDQALRDVGIDKDTCIDAKAKNLSLGIALKANLANVNGQELTVIEHKGAFIVTPPGCSDLYEITLYNVGSLGITGERLEQFVTLLEEETSGPWDAEEPGTGSISVFPHRSSLLVRHTPKVQREILVLLRDLRSLPKDQPLFADPRSGGKQVQTKYYSMAPETAKALVKLIPESIAKGSWELDDSTNKEAPQTNLGAALKADSPLGRITLVNIPGEELTLSLLDPSVRNIPMEKQSLGDAGVVRQALGGTGPGYTFVEATYLAVTHTPEVHTSIVRFLKALHGVGPAPFDGRNGFFEVPVRDKSRFGNPHHAAPTKAAN